MLKRLVDKQGVPRGFTRVATSPSSCAFSYDCTQKWRLRCLFDTNVSYAPSLNYVRHVRSTVDGRTFSFKFRFLLQWRHSSVPHIFLSSSPLLVRAWCYDPPTSSGRGSAEDWASLKYCSFSHAAFSLLTDRPRRDYSRIRDMLSR